VSLASSPSCGFQALGNALAAADVDAVAALRLLRMLANKDMEVVDDGVCAWDDFGEVETVLKEPQAVDREQLVCANPECSGRQLELSRLLLKRQYSDKLQKAIPMELLDAQVVSCAPEHYVCPNCAQIAKVCCAAVGKFKNLA